jgi:hypothetical protein
MSDILRHARPPASALAATALLCGVLSTAHAAPNGDGRVVPQPIPARFDFPLPAATIDAWVAASDTTAIRARAWDLWAGLTSPSGQVHGGKELPIWETWFGTDEVFPPLAPASSASAASSATAAARGGANRLLALSAEPRRGLHAFISPRQFHHARAGLHALDAQLGNAADSVVSFNKFDPAAAFFLTSRHPGPGGQLFSYDIQASLQSLNSAWPAGTGGEARATAEFPVDAVELKPVMRIVKAQGLTPQPLWQGPAASTNPANPTPGTWTNCVLIDPAGKGLLRPATPQEIAKAAAAGAGTACKSFSYGPLSLFYSFKLDAAEAAAFRQAQGGGASAQAGDFAVLVAMHVNTKEIPFWTWQTFWWQPGADTPNGFPGSKAGQPAGLPSPWNNYASCANYAQTTAPGGSTMQVCFNPYLETSPGIPAGVTSNCMSCHGTARVMADTNAESYPENYKAPISFFSDPAYFNASSTHTDFSWAIPGAQLP